jgi:hypothetical protein
MIDVVDPRIIDKLRRDQSLRQLPDGRQGVDVTLQHVGSVPAESRPERKDWLSKRFSSLNTQFDARLHLKPESLSISGQSIDATVPVDDVDDLQEKLSRQGVRLAITRMVKVVDG